jgi:hypothetical protein
MANSTYKFELSIISNPNGSNQDQPTERLDAPVHSFEVDGGANRKILASSPNLISISSEFEQARNYQNIIFYIPPTKDFLAVKIAELGSTIKHFDLTFIVSTYSGKTMIQTLRLQCRGAWFLRKPIPIGSTPPLLKAEARFHARDVQLLHGEFDSKRKKIVHKEI